MKTCCSKLPHFLKMYATVPAPARLSDACAVSGTRAWTNWCCYSSAALTVAAIIIAGNFSTIRVFSAFPLPMRPTTPTMPQRFEAFRLAYCTGAGRGFSLHRSGCDDLIAQVGFRALSHPLQRVVERLVSSRAGLCDAAPANSVQDFLLKNRLKATY